MWSFKKGNRKRDGKIQEVRLNSNGEVMGFLLKNIPGWIHTNGFYPYHFLINGISNDKWAGEWASEYSFRKSARKLCLETERPCLVFKLVGIAVPNSVQGGKDEVSITKHTGIFAEFEGREVTENR